MLKKLFDVTSLCFLSLECRLSDPQVHEGQAATDNDVGQIHNGPTEIWELTFSKPG